VEKSPPGLLKPLFLIGNTANEDIPWSQQSPTTQDFTCREEEFSWYINAPAFEGVLAGILHISICIAT
jgi:hypothetical protein